MLVMLHLLHPELNQLGSPHALLSPQEAFIRGTCEPTAIFVLAELDTLMRQSSGALGRPRQSCGWHAGP